ncbi:MAG: hypothetical protein G3M70_08365 [Candidatus Nitronauta litoralis]|uniref:Lipoprotein n=1 Tax=Candidatus Nitronauta litoralis TaxID=2705533 RepID=A0A7T0BVT9_9BACT|nr:MAG: hypothetical protein G3M70_08365 [Candidatus Nitronauta litoralis]
MTRWIIVFLCLPSIVACGGTEQSQEPLAMPPKEKTWVKTESVEQTREAYLARADKAPRKISIDTAFQQALLKEAAQPKGVVKDKASCEAAFRPLEEKRKVLQRSGGMWHAFERVEEIRPFSNTGMQIDSNFNKLAQAVQHLCATANGVPKSSVARMIEGIIRDKGGKEGARQHLVDMGRAKKDIEIWLNYEASAEKATTRTVPYETIEGLIRKLQTLLDGYEDLYNRKVTAEEKDAFLSQSKTLLAVISDSLENVPELSMALAEDMAEPHIKFTGEM